MEAATPPAPRQEARRVGSWVLESQIGSGSFAVVWRARHAGTGEAGAIKEIALNKLNAKLRQSLESEVSILRRITHPNIVHLHEVLQERGKLFLVMEYCAGGDLAHYLRAARRVPEPVARHFMAQLAAGLREMWAHHLVHRDLKPQNLLLSECSPTAVLKIADFGFARNLQPQGLAETLCGSPLYMAPEILHFHKYDAKADLWSVGAVLYELLAGRPPFTGSNQFQLLRNIERGEARLPEALAATLSPSCRALIQGLLRRNPVERLSFEEFFRHPFVAPAAPEEAGGGGGAPPAAGRPPSGARAARPGAAGAAPGLLLFSTSAPAAALPGGPLERSPSAGSIPQQVLGFAQAAGAGAPDAASGAGTGGIAPAAVPVSQLSSQLKPRLSLDLDGKLHPRRLATVQQAQHRWRVPLHAPAPAPAQPLQRQASPALPVGTPGLLGAAGRLAAMSAGTAPATAPGWPSSVGSPAGGIQRVHGFSPAAAPPPSKLQQPAGEGLAGSRTRAASGTVVERNAGAGRGAATGGSESTLSIDDDYVLVDTSFASTVGGSGPAPAAPRGASQGSMAAASATGRDSHAEARPPPVLATSPAAAAPPAPQAATKAAAPDEVFAVCHDVHSGGALAEAGQPAASGGAASWLGAARWRLLHRAALALESMADEQRPRGKQAMSLLLGAVQLLEGSLAAASEVAGAAEAAAEAAPAASPFALATGGGSPAPAAAGGLDALRQDAARLVERAAAAAAVLQGAGAAAVPAPDGSLPLPDPWDLAYAGALRWARDAAVDELLGNQQRSLRLYSQAGTVLSVLASEATASPGVAPGGGLALEPLLQLAPADITRLQQYAAATGARWAACAEAAADVKAGAGGAPPGRQADAGSAQT